MVRSPTQKTRSFLGLSALGLAAGLGGCYQKTPFPPCWFEGDPGCIGENASEGGSFPEGTTITPTSEPLPGEGSGTTTGTEGHSGAILSSEAGLTETTSGTTGELVPVITGMTVMPNVVPSAGPVVVSVQAENAETVWMTVDGGEAVELAAVEEGGDEFSGEIAVLGESWNGPHIVSATAARGELTSPPWEEMFTVAAPTAGLEVWKKKSTIVPSYGNAVAVDGDSNVYELFTESSQDGERCHLRRRDVMGDSVWQGDTRVLAPGPDCIGEDVKVAPDGTVWALVNTWSGGVQRWRLFHLDSDGVELGGSDVGDVHEVGAGLDVNPVGDVLLCGTRPATQDDDDAWVRLKPTVGMAWTLPWDYVPPSLPPHTINERTKDCAFVEDRIVVVGEAFGQTDKNILLDQGRGFALEVSTNSAILVEAVSPPSPAWQSSHEAVAPVSSGGYVVVGHTCNKQDVPCAPTKGTVRWFELGGVLAWETPVSAAVTVRDVASSPAGHAVVAAQGVTQEYGFLMQAWSPGNDQPLWDYQGAPSELQVATGIAVDPFAYVFVVGYYLDEDAFASGVVKLHPL
jgi:hypothetical protein